MADDPGAMAGAAGYMFSGFGHFPHGLILYCVAGLSWGSVGVVLVGMGDNFAGWAGQEQDRNLDCENHLGGLRSLSLTRGIYFS